VIGKDGDREEVIKKYRAYIYNKPEMIEKARAELQGKIIACHCAPLACHGDILAEIANAAEPTRNSKVSEEKNSTTAKEAQKCNKGFSAKINIKSEEDFPCLSSSTKSKK
jgi:hypothetical protein